MKEGIIWRRSAADGGSFRVSAELDLAPWKAYMPDDAPYAEASVSYDAEALYVAMRAYERRILFAHTKRNSPVCEDSCLEFFFSPDPGSRAYFNFEVNPIGTMYIGYSPAGTREDSRPLTDAPDNAFFAMRAMTQAQAERFCACAGEPTDYWQIAYRIPYTFIRTYCPTFDPFRPDALLMANFYTCADGAAQPHYVVWNPIQTPAPDYHVPACFGRLLFEPKNF